MALLPMISHTLFRRPDTPWHCPPPFVPRSPAARRCETAGQVCTVRQCGVSFGRMTMSFEMSFEMSFS